MINWFKRHILEADLTECCFDLGELRVLTYLISMEAVLNAKTFCAVKLYPSTICSTHLILPRPVKIFESFKVFV